MKCKVEICDHPSLALGYCNGHYLRLKKGKELDTKISPRGGYCHCGKKNYGRGLCQSHYNKEMRKQRWEYFIQKLGGSCFDCKISYPYQVYDFHHLDPTQKDISISNEITNRSIEDLEKEVEKCVLLCANCHRIRHAELGKSSKLDS